MTDFYTFTFSKPEVNIWLFVLIPIAILMFMHYKRHFPLISKLVSGIVDNEHQKASSIKLNLQRRYILSSGFFLLFLASLIISLADPRMGSTYVREFRRGADVIFAIDISRSMNIKDLDDMTRMERAVQISENLINAMPDGIQLRTGIALGKGNGILAVPISSDSEAALAILNALSSSIMSSRGTNLEKLVDAATDGFIESSPAGRQIVLLSDGEGLSGSLSAACERAKRKDITLIAVGIGSETGALVSENSSQDDKNTMIRSFLHRSTLKNAVERTGGSYIDGNSNSAEREIAEKIYPFAESSSWTYREESGSQWHIFLVAAIIFLSLSIGLTKSKR